MRLSRLWIVALFGCGVAAGAWAPSGCSDPNRVPPVLPGLTPDPSVNKPTVAPVQRHADIPELTPAAYLEAPRGAGPRAEPEPRARASGPGVAPPGAEMIVLDAGMIIDGARPVDAAP